MFLSFFPQCCFNSDVNSSFKSTLSIHNSWLVNFDSSIDGPLITKGPNIEMMTLRILLFDTDKLLSTTWICKTSFCRCHSNPSTLSFSSKPIIFDDILLFCNFKYISRPLDIHLCKRKLPVFKMLIT